MPLSPTLNYKQSPLHSIPFIAFSTRDSLFSSFAVYHPSHFSFFREISNEFFPYLLIHTNISHSRNTIYLYEDKLCGLMSFLLIISDIFREGEYKTEERERESPSSENCTEEKSRLIGLLDEPRSSYSGHR